jgi:peptide/nickel transport system permease protein
MAAESISIPPAAGAAAKKTYGAFFRIVQYTAIRLLTLFITVVIGIYLTILIANMGGYVDQIQRAQIRETVQQLAQNDASYRLLSAEKRAAKIQELVALREERLGLDQPFMLRSFNFLTNALTLNLGWSQNMISDSGSKQVRLIMLERLPSTLLLFGLSNVILFIVSIYMALSLSRRYGSWLDKLTVALAPTSSAPGWFYGLFLIVFFASFLHILPYGGMVDAPPPDNPVSYALSLARHLILPMIAITLSTIFLSAYNWRTFFLIYSSEDYVDMARAKGLTARDIERDYILRPTLPTIITNFALTLISLWTGAPILETTFNWPGLGRTLYQAVGLYDTPVIVGSTVIFAYLLAITVFLLDFVYALVDPRVKIGGGQSRSS